MQRDLRLDTIRGVLLIIMTIDHLGLSISGFTYEPFGFVSSAAAFVLLSGYMYAYTSGRFGTTAYPLMVEAAKRAAKIYKYHVVTLLSLLLIASFSDVYLSYWKNDLFVTEGKTLLTAAAGLLLLNQPALMDILPMYIIFSLLSPIALACFIKGHQRVIFLASVLLWLCGQYFDPLKEVAEQGGIGAHPGFFNVLSWQSLWIAGMYFGFAHKSQRELRFLKSHSVLWTAGLLAVGFLILKQGGYASLSTLNVLFGKADIQFGRIINIGCQIIIFCRVLSLVQATSQIRWMSYLGQYSLQVFTFHIFLIYLAKPFNWRVEPILGAGGEIAYQLVIMASLTLAPVLYKYYKNKVERRCKSAVFLLLQFMRIGRLGKRLRSVLQ